MALAAATTGAVYFAVRAHGRPWLALGAALLTGTSPLFVANFNWVQSEYLFTSLFFVAVGALHLSTSRSPHWWMWALCGSMALAASIHVRTLGILLLPAIVIVAYSRRSEGGLRRALLPLGLTVAAMLPWMLHVQSATAEAERPSEQLLLFDYSTAFFHEDPGDPDSARVSFGSWMERITSNGGAMARALATTTMGSDATWAATLVSALLLAGLVLAALTDPALIAWFSIFGGMVLLGYFVYADRLLVPFVPCAYILALLVVDRAVRAMASRFGRPSLVPIGSVAVFGLLLSMNAATMQVRMDPTAGYVGQRRALYWQDLYATAEWLRENTPTDAIVLCNEAPILSYLSGRRTYTYRHQRTPDLLTKYDVDFVVFDGPHSPMLNRLVSERSGDTWMLPAQSRVGNIEITAIRKSRRGGGRSGP
jgi:hypothetical protein